MTDQTTLPVISILIAARNEEAYIGTCLQSLLAQIFPLAGGFEVIVAANACTDATVEKALGFARSFADLGHRLKVLNLAEGGKLGALAAAEAAAEGRVLAYLDADVTCDPTLLAEIVGVLDHEVPLYATGTLHVAKAATAITRIYARIWVRLPFVQGGAVGAGFFAMNRAGRARWDAWPRIISDDTFARLNFLPAERIEVSARYHWPMVEGFGNLVRVRRRQDAGVAEIARLYPGLLKNEAKAPITKAILARLAMTDPLGLAVYLSVHVAVRLRRKTGEWTRGR